MALIATGERDAAPSPIVAGRSLVLRQFDFARACGVERVIAYGNGAPEEVIALKHEAERARIAYSAIASAHALVALVDWADELLVLQPGLLPEAGVGIDALRQGDRVLSFSAGAVLGAPFERIDAANLWAGVLVIPGALVDRLEQLGDDADPHAALLRIALQSHLPLHQLPAGIVTNGNWTRIKPGADEAAFATSRVRRLAAMAGTASLSGRLAEWVGVRFAHALAHRRFAAGAGVALALCLLAAPLAAAWYGYAAPAFAGIALAVPVLHLSRLVERVRRASFQRPRLPHWLGVLPDAALFAAAALAIEGAWYRQIFPPLVLLIALHTSGPGGRWRAVVGDRALGALTLAGAALAGATEPALMAWALLVLGATSAPPILVARRRS